MKKRSSLLLFGILVLLGTAAYGGYLFWQVSVVEKELIGVNSQLESVKAEKLNYLDREVVEAVNAKKAYERITDEMILWSDVIKKIRQDMPQGAQGKSLVDILSYSGSGNNEISMNVKTKADSDKPYFDVAKLIRAFDSSENFKNPFVPSISSGLDDEGREVLTFLMSMEFVSDVDPLELLNEPIEEVERSVDVEEEDVEEEPAEVEEPEEEDTEEETPADAETPADEGVSR